MTVKELIEKLKEYPKEAEIQLDSDNQELTRSEIADIEYISETNIVVLSDYID